VGVLVAPQGRLSTALRFTIREVKVTVIEA
jgi:hypothetical protein